MKNLQAIVFDLDDTLYPERAFIDSGLRHVAGWVSVQLQLAAEEVYQDLSRLHSHGIRGRLFDAWLESRRLPESHLPAMVAAYRSHLPRIEPFPNVANVLKRLQVSFLVGLVSDGYLLTQRQKLDALGLRQFFHSVVFSDQLGRQHWKPAPAPFERLLRELGVAAHDTVYVGDNPTKDFLGARRAGLWSIRLRYPVGIYAQLQPESDDHAPDAEIQSFDQLPELLMSWSHD